MPLSRPRYFGNRPLAWLVLLFLSITIVNAAMILAQPVPVRPGPSDIPSLPEISTISPVPHTDSDSIYATEITVDLNGATFVDRSGHRRHLSIFSVSENDKRRMIDSIGPDSAIVISRHRNQEDVVHLASDVTVDKDETIRGAVVCVFGGHVDILGKVTGDAVSVFGSVNVDGYVAGDVVAPFGRVHIGPNGSVAGDVVASEIDKEPGGRIGGKREEILFNVFGSNSLVPVRSWPHTTLTVLVVLNALFWFFLVLLAHALAAKNVSKIKETIEHASIKAFVIGLVAEVLILPVFLLLLVTIIGIPVAIFLLPLMVAATLVLSQASIGLLVGEKITQNTALALRTPMTRTLTGYLVLQSIPLLGLVFTWIDGGEPATASLRMVSITLFGITILLGYFITTIGAGAVVMTRFGTRPKHAIPVPGAVVPPPGSEVSDHLAPTPLPQPGFGASDTAKHAPYG